MKTTNNFLKISKFSQFIAITVLLLLNQITCEETFIQDNQQLKKSFLANQASNNTQTQQSLQQSKASLNQTKENSEFKIQNGTLSNKNLNNTHQNSTFLAVNVSLKVKIQNSSNVSQKIQNSSASLKTNVKVQNNSINEKVQNGNVFQKQVITNTVQKPKNAQVSQIQQNASASLKLQNSTAVQKKQIQTQSKNSSVLQLGKNDTSSKPKTNKTATQAPSIKQTVNNSTNNTPKNISINKSNNSLQQNNAARLYLDDKFISVNYVQKISDFAREDLRAQREPNYKNRYMIGKSFYLENNVTYDETPKIMGQVVTDSLIKIDKTQKNSEEKLRLWRQKQNRYQDVQYKGEKEEPVQYIPMYSNAAFKKGEVQQQNNQNYIENVLQNSRNPLQSVHYQNQFEQHLNLNNPDEKYSPQGSKPNQFSFKEAQANYKLEQVTYISRGYQKAKQGGLQSKNQKQQSLQNEKVQII